MKDNEIKKLMMDVPMVLCRNMNNRFISAIIKNSGYDLAHHHLMVLRTLSEREVMYATELVEFLGIPKPQMTSSIDKLVNLGFVTRKHDDKDRRKIYIKITSAGKDMIIKVKQQADEKISENFKLLSREEAQDLGKGLSVLFKFCKFYEEEKLK